MDSNIRIQLKNRMTNCFMAVNKNRNIVLLRLNELSKEELTYILSQYFQFPRHIVSVLVSATYTFGYHGWTEVVGELRENVFEELGGGCGHIATEYGPHYSIVRKELENVFQVDVQESRPSPATTQFLDGLNVLMQSEPWKAAGGVFALEASAVPELGIVIKLVNHLASLHRKPLTRNIVNFFKFHMNDIEVGHRDRLIKLLEGQLSDSSKLATFVEGYDEVLHSMDVWWTSLNQEAQTKPVAPNFAPAH